MTLFKPEATELGLVRAGESNTEGEDTHMTEAEVRPFDECGLDGSAVHRPRVP